MAESRSDGSPILAAGRRARLVWAGFLRLHARELLRLIRGRLGPQ